MRTILLAMSVLGACTNRPELAVRKAPPLFPTDGTHFGTTTGTSGTDGTTPSTHGATSSTSDTSSSTTTPTSSTTTPSTSSTTTTTGDPPYGIDISHWNETIDWTKVGGDGWGFSMCKATEGTYYISDAFSSEYDGAYDQGMIRGSYHFAAPDDSDGATQADYFVDHGGGWSADGWTIPGELDIEWNPYGDTCYGLSKSEMVQWIHDFDDEYYARTGRVMAIYTAASWWNQCVDSSDFSGNPLWVANWGVSSPALPNGWSDWTFWQYDDSGSVAGISGGVDVDVFYGSPSQLYHFALGD